MSDRPSHNATITLGLCTILHGFTHAYQQLLVPLYFVMVADLHLRGVKDATFIVTVYGLVYFLGSYGAGILADRFDRKWILGIGTIANALAIGLMGVTRQYEVLVLLGVVAGLAGTLFHPAANALSTAHYPKSPGMSIGILGIGAGLGFFFGPQFSGWRTDQPGPHWIDVANWQVPCVEAGIAGVVVGVLFLIFAREVPHPHLSLDQQKRVHPPIGAKLRWRMLRLAPVIGLRDFAGVANVSLVSIYLTKAHGMDTKQVGFVIGFMMLLSVVVNPLAVWVSPKEKRLPMLAALFIVGGIVLATVAYWPVAWVVVALGLFYTCQLGSYAVGDAAIIERIEPVVRGRVFGLLLTIAGTMGAIGPWAAGFWADSVGVRVNESSTYVIPFAVLGLLMALSALSIPLIARLNADRPPEDKPDVIPATLEAVP